MHTAPVAEFYRVYLFQKESMLHLVLRLRGGGSMQPEVELGVAVGGKIEQKIYPDVHCEPLYLEINSIPAVQ